MLRKTNEVANDGRVSIGVEKNSNKAAVCQKVARAAKCILRLLSISDCAQSCALCTVYTVRIEASRQTADNRFTLFFFFSLMYTASTKMDKNFTFGSVMASTSVAGRIEVGDDCNNTARLYGSSCKKLGLLLHGG